MTVAGLLLAAGGGQRLGRPKATVPFGGHTLVERGVQTLRHGGCEEIVVVTGADAEAVGRLVGTEVALAMNPAWAQGLSTSLRVGLDAVAATPADAAVIALVDQPLITAQAVARLITVWQSGAAAAVATYDGRPRNPVLLDRAVWSDVAGSSSGEAGARVWLQAHPALVTSVACDDIAAPDDIDTPADLARLERTDAARS